VAATALIPAAHRDTFTFMANVKERRRGATTISSKNQITIPAAELRAAGLEAGERLVARADGPGRVILERQHDVLADFAGALTGVYTDHGVDALRDEWD
jgi:bifunctional DNA-binding transcriptional regulator/antitoxin component of YhaV-PrlF toxin-antitoxin module